LQQPCSDAAVRDTDAGPPPHSRAVPLQAALVIVHPAVAPSERAARPEGDEMTTTESPHAVAGPEEIDAFVGRFATDLAAVLHGATVVLGDKLGLYAALAERGPSTAAELAAATGCDERFLREWLSAQAAAEYAHYDPSTDRFHLDAAQATCLGDERAPTFMAGGMAVASSLHKDDAAVVDAFRSGAGVGWHQHHHDLFIGTERFFRPGYVANLTTAWIPAFPGLDERLRRGAKVADVGCGHGASTILLAEAYPASTFVGFDYHESSIDVARERAAAAGVGDRVRFEVAPADAFPGEGYDLVCIFDALHDMGHPDAAAAHIRRSLAADGVLLLVEPNAADRLEDNLNLVGKIFYSASSFICTPASRTQGGGDAACLGAQAGETRLRDLLTGAGFSSVRVAATTPFNMVLDVRP
jgi:SAM-dependent methyltransferase